MKKPIFFETAGVSDIGKQRQLNEDSLTSNDELGLYAIADGMGGHMHGDVASQVTIDTLTREISRLYNATRELEKQEDCYETVENAITTCNDLVLQKNLEIHANLGEGMGSTLVGAYFLKNSMKAITFNVGDSRIYRLRDGDLTQLTRDHTLYQEWVDAGGHGMAPSKSILINAVGLVEDLSADIKLENVTSGDMYLLCSDGLSTLVDDKTLQKSLSDNCKLPVATVCKQLVDLANINGGTDNISVIIIRVNGNAITESVVNTDTQITEIRNKRG
ncbi:MAG: PP2C family serine/threonine-protein phosphatase [Granulosicoccus sp.]